MIDAAAFVFKACSVCDSNEFIELDFLSEYEDYQWKRLVGPEGRSRWVVCKRCGFVFQNPVLKKEFLEKLYVESAYHEVPSFKTLGDHFITFSMFLNWKKPRFAVKVYQKLFERKPRNVLEIGCGYGGAGKYFELQGIRFLGYEPDKPHFDFGTSVLGLNMINTLLGEATAPKDETFDLVYSHHTLEHVFNINETLEIIRKLLSPSGLVFTIVPTYRNARSREATYNFGKMHYYMYDHLSLNALCAKHGIEPVGFTYRGSLYDANELWHWARNAKPKNISMNRTNANEIYDYIKDEIPKIDKRNAVINKVVKFSFEHYVRLRGALIRRAYMYFGYGKNSALYSKLFKHISLPSDKT